MLIYIRQRFTEMTACQKCQNQFISFILCDRSRKKIIFQCFFIQEAMSMNSSDLSKEILQAFLTFKWPICHHGGDSRCCHLSQGPRGDITGFIGINKPICQDNLQHGPSDLCQLWTVNWVPEQKKSCSGKTRQVYSHSTIHI